MIKNFIKKRNHGEKPSQNLVLFSFFEIDSITTFLEIVLFEVKSL